MGRDGVGHPRGLWLPKYQDPARRTSCTSAREHPHPGARDSLPMGRPKDLVRTCSMALNPRSGTPADIHPQEGNRFKLCAVPDFETVVLDRVYSPDGIVEFTSPDETVYPLPSRRCIALHAVACKVANLSGAAGLFDELDDQDDACQLDGAGTDAVILEDKLWHLVGN